MVLLRTYCQRWNRRTDKASVAGQAHRRPWRKKIIATECGYGQIEVCRRRTLAGISLTSRSCAPTRVPFKHLWGLQMIKAKESKWVMFAALPPPLPPEEIADNP